LIDLGRCLWVIFFSLKLYYLRSICYKAVEKNLMCHKMAKLIPNTWKCFGKEWVFREVLIRWTIVVETVRTKLSIYHSVRWLWSMITGYRTCRKPFDNLNISFIIFKVSIISED
jgi:hypothetical protein